MEQARVGSECTMTGRAACLPTLIDRLFVRLSQTRVAAINEGGIFLGLTVNQGLMGKRLMLSADS